MNDQDLLPYSVLAADIANSSAHITADQRQLREDFRFILTACLTRLGIELAAPGLRDDGDGALGLVPASVPRERLVADLPREFAMGLARRNSDRLDSHRLRVRFALHHGLAQPSGNGWVSSAINTTAGILDADEGRLLLRHVPTANLVLLLSQAMYDDTVHDQRRDLHPADFAPMRIGPGRKGAGTALWVCLWGTTQSAPSPEVLTAIARETGARPDEPDPGKSGPGESGPHEPGPAQPDPAGPSSPGGSSAGFVVTTGDRSPVIIGDVDTLNFG
ncbi:MULTISPECIES: hypothetical protein [unclassified Frankia]|uniref:hypothetical protein n=1 Tax=unclassified Frankia TaxID=2632575 RepID=UPI002AD2D517|nr:MULTISPECIES: hypothetical protein [unclassified Frankia]